MSILKDMGNTPLVKLKNPFGDNFAQVYLRNNSNIVYTGYQVADNNLIIYFNNLNENELSDIQYLSKNNTFKSTMLKANSIIIENSDFLPPLKLHFLKNNHVVNEMIIHVQ